MRAITATILVLACLALLYVLGDAAWRALSDLPSREQMQQTADRVKGAVSISPRREATQSAAAPAPAPAAQRAPAPAPASTRNSNVRFIEQDGIVGIHVDGPLERAPAAVREEPPAPPPKEEPDLYRLVIIDSAGQIDVRSHKIRLAHVEAPATDATCRNADGTTWPCGMRARTALRRLIRRRAIACFDPDKDTAAEKALVPRDGEVRTADCTVAGTDISEWLLENGWAMPTDTTPEPWRSLNAEAKEAGRGLYATNGR